MISVQRHIDALEDKMDAAVRLLDVAHSSPGDPADKEARGLIMVLLFASYERLLKDLTKTVLQGAVDCRVSTKRLKPGLMSFALATELKGALARSEKKRYTDSLPGIINAFHASKNDCTIDVNAFPDDGTFMRPSQVELWCRIFDLPHPGSTLGKTWTYLNAVVVDRNSIAHGQVTPDVVGRRFTETEIRIMVEDWRKDWVRFIQLVGTRGSSRDFYRTP
jgi:hypothetical protein